MKNLFDELIDGRQYFEQLKRKDNIVCWGAGSKGRQTLKILKEKGIQPVAFCDSNPDLSGRCVDNIPVYEYETIKRLYQRYCLCITCTLSNALEIYHKLQMADEKNEIYFLSNPFKVENKFLNMEELEKNREGYEKSYEVLTDEISRKVFIDFLNWKITGDISIPYKNNEKGWLEFFDTELIPQKEDYCYIDVGAYTGDSICRFLALVQGKYKRIIAFEPDEGNFEVLESFVKNARLEEGRTELICEGLWSKEEKKILYKRSEKEIYESSNFFRDVSNTLCNNMMTGEEVNEVKEVAVKTLDSYLYLFQEENNILLKIDALASEGAIIQGASRLIKEKKPIIVMEYGTHSEYIANLIPFLRGLRPDYKFYLRQHESMSNSRTVLYVV